MKHIYLHLGWLNGFQLKGIKMSTENLGPPEQNGYGLSFLETYLSENPESMLFARLADYYLESQRVDEAIRVCEDGIKKHPYYATGHFVLGKSYLANKMYEQAEKEFKRVLLFDPKFLAAHKMYGDLMKEIGWENTCEMSYKKILQIDPLDEVARSVVEAAEAETIDAEPEAVKETNPKKRSNLWRRRSHLRKRNHRLWLMSHLFPGSKHEIQWCQR